MGRAGQDETTSNSSRSHIRLTVSRDRDTQACGPLESRDRVTACACSLDAAPASDSNTPPGGDTVKLIISRILCGYGNRGTPPSTRKGARCSSFTSTRSARADRHRSFSIRSSSWLGRCPRCEGGALPSVPCPSPGGEPPALPPLPPSPRSRPRSRPPPPPAASAAAEGARDAGDGVVPYARKLAWLGLGLGY